MTKEKPPALGIIFLLIALILCGLLYIGWLQNPPFLLEGSEKTLGAPVVTK